MSMWCPDQCRWRFRPPLSCPCLLWSTPKEAEDTRLINRRISWSPFNNLKKKREDGVNRSGSFKQFADEISTAPVISTHCLGGWYYLQLPKIVQCSTRPSQFAKSQMNTGAEGWNVSKRKREWFFGRVALRVELKCTVLKGVTGLVLLPHTPHRAQDGTRAKKWNCLFEHCRVCLSPFGLS